MTLCKAGKLWFKVNGIKVVTVEEKCRKKGMRSA
jgi:hypothetical protein